MAPVSGQPGLIILVRKSMCVKSLLFVTLRTNLYRGSNPIVIKFFFGISFLFRCLSTIYIEQTPLEDLVSKF